MMNNQKEGPVNTPKAPVSVSLASKLAKTQELMNRLREKDDLDSGFGDENDG